MTNPVIRVENLGKRYVLGRQQQRGPRARVVRDDLADAVKAPLRWAWHRLGLKGGIPPAPETELWALRNVSFEIGQGEVVGIIGRNGAGKSTLLKVLSRITIPTAGRITLKGRVASLLEVGTGFHPELTGRENIFLNGAILGMHRREIKARFDEIVAFAEVEKFLETPVKRYSSGMYVRLAFAVAAHLEPEILIIDEVLAVGDADFQEKCLGKMKSVAEGGGRTVIFVSHNMGAVEQLCRRALLLERGGIAQDARDVRAVVQRYLLPRGDSRWKAEWIAADDQEFASPWFAPRRLRIAGAAGGTLTNVLANDEEAWIEIEAEVDQLDPALNVGYAIYTGSNELVYWSCHTDASPKTPLRLVRGRNLLRTRLPRRLLNEGTYRIELIGNVHHRFWILEPSSQVPTIYFEVQGGLSESPFWNAKRPGLLAPVLPWESAA